MLYNLLNQISAVIPIQMLSETDNGIEILYYEDNLPSLEQEEQINNLLQSWPLYQLKLQKIEQLDSNWKEMLKTGWITSYGYSLGIDIQDIALLNGAFTLAKEASLMGMIDPVSIVDLNGISHSLSLQDLTLLMLQYGQARSLLSNSYASIKQAINSAESIEEINSVNLTIGA